MLHNAQTIDQLARQQAALVGQLRAWRSSGRLAYENARDSLTIPDLGNLVLVDRKARMGRNPVVGAAIQIPAKRVVKFRVAKAAKDAVLGAK